MMGYNQNAFSSYIYQCVNKWNKVLEGLVKITPCFSNENITICFGKIDKTEDKTRVGYCQRIREMRWMITLDEGTKWNLGKTPTTSAIKDVLGIGENVEKVIMHELGHVFKIPHSKEKSDVMYPKCVNKDISKQEAEWIRSLI